MKVLFSLFDHSGISCKPYRENGWEVIQVDIKLGTDILAWDYKKVLKGILKKHNLKASDLEIGIISMPPCTDYANCGARHFAKKDANGTTAKSQVLVARLKEIIDHLKSNYNVIFWYVENPKTRIHKLNPWLGKITYKFHPYYFGQPYRKETWLFGEFNKPSEGPFVKPLGVNKGKPDDWYSKVGGRKNEKAKEKAQEYRSITPEGFAVAFYQANNDYKSRFVQKSLF